MPDLLTPEQRQQWEEARMDEPTDETPLFRALSFRMICRWEGVEPPPRRRCSRPCGASSGMANPLTPDQREVWDEEGMGDRPTVPSGQQTIEQALNFRAAEFRHICRLDGVEPPSEETIREALRAGVGQ